MALSSGNSLLNTLRGKIWISTTVLAFFICTFGLISYLVVTLLTSNPFYGVFIPFIFLAFSVIVFGWWLSSELVSPIENVVLLSKSLERNSSTSLPKTSGSAETDQLLQTLHRNSQQLQNVINLMDKVANGNIDIALSPLKGSDRLTASFQKLLSKVSESINAKEDLNKLKSELDALNADTSSIRNGNLNIEVKSDYFQTKEISETINYLVENLTLLITLIKVDSNQASESAKEIDKTIANIIDKDEEKIQKMNQASITLKQVPNLIEKITEDLTRSAKSATQTIEKTRKGTKISQNNSASVSKLRSNLRESVNRIQGLNERSQEIAKVAKIVDDLASRTNMIALNASIQATELGEDGHKFVLVSEELERLAARADGTNKQISILNSSILSEIGRVEDSLETTMGDVAGLAKYSIETGNVLSELERYMGQFLNLQENLIAFSNDKSDETNGAFETFIDAISETEIDIQELANSAKQTKEITKLMKNLELHSTEFRILPLVGSNDSQTLKNKPVEDQISAFEELNESEKPENQENLDFSTDDFNQAKLSTEEFNLMSEDTDKISGKNTASEATISDQHETNDSFSEDIDALVEESFDTEESNIENPDSRDFNSEELFSEDLQSIENLSDPTDDFGDVVSAEDDSLSILNEKFASNEFDSSEFLKDDLSIDLDQLENPENDDSVLSNVELSENEDDDKLLNITNHNNNDNNPEISA